MPPPSQLAIATGAVTRLLKEEASYHKELADQEAEVKKLEESIRNGGGDGDDNAEFMLKQNVRSLPFFAFISCFNSRARARARIYIHRKERLMMPCLFRKPLLSKQRPSLGR